MRNIMLFAAGAFVGFQLAIYLRNKSQPPGGYTPEYYKQQDIPSTRTKTKDFVEARQTPTMGAFNPSYLPGARPQHPFQVRWGYGNNFEDTTKKARLVI